MHTIHIRPLLYLATITCIAAGCPEDVDTPDGQLLADSAADSVADSTSETSPDAEVSAEVAPTCCPIAQTPECGCVPVGGVQGADGQCAAQVCDSNPADWVTLTDSDGCPYLETGNGSCLGGGPDADAEVTVDAEDVGDAEVAEVEPDADDGDTSTDDAEVLMDAEVSQPEVMVDTEVSQPEVSPLCCPIAETQECSCVPLGGSPDSSGECGPPICDSNPADWVYGTDENGCPTLDVGTGSCL